MKIPPHLSMYNLAEDHLPTFVQALQDWSDALAEFIVANPHPDDGTYLREAAIFAFERSGVRCMAVEILDEYCRLENWPSVLNEIHTAAFRVGDPKRLVAPISEIRTLARNAEFCLLFVSADSMQSPPRRHKMTWRTWPGKILYFNAPVILKPPQASTIQPAVAPSEIFAKGTKSQRQAIRELAELIQVKRTGLSLGGITPRTTALLVGMSGSGKTWAANAVATMAKLPCFECTIGSWAITGGRSDVPSNEALRRHLRENGPSVILVDEFDKLRRRRDDNANYLAFVFDEVMSVIDGRVSSWSAWTSEDVSALKASHFIGAGAFQDLYRAELGRGPVMIEEEISSLEALTFARIVEAEWLPDELLNRLGSVIEIRPPEVAEIVERMVCIEADAGINDDDPERENKARLIATSVTGMRGLEIYALELAKYVQREKRRVDRSK